MGFKKMKKLELTSTPNAKTYVTFCTIWYHLYNLKNVRSEKCHPWRSVTFSKVAGF